MPDHNISPEILLAALEALESQRDRVVTQIAEVRGMLGTRIGSSPELTTPAQEPKRKMSAASRKRIAAAQRKRWQAYKKASQTTTAAKPHAGTAKAAPPRKRRMSAAGRKRIIEAAKRRWAAFRKQAKSSTAGPKSAGDRKAGRKTSQPKRAEKVKAPKRAPVPSTEPVAAD